MLEPGGIEELGGQPHEAVRLEERARHLAPDLVARLRFGREQEQLEIAAQGCERGAQLVAGDGHELLLQPSQLAISDVPDHDDTAFAPARLAERPAEGLEPAPLAMLPGHREIEGKLLAGSCQSLG